MNTPWLCPPASMLEPGGFNAGLCQPYIGMATVLGTFLFGPLVYLLTQLAFLVLYNKRALTNQVRGRTRAPISATSEAGGSIRNRGKQQSYADGSASTVLQCHSVMNLSGLYSQSWQAERVSPGQAKGMPRTG